MSPDSFETRHVSRDTIAGYVSEQTDIQTGSSQYLSPRGGQSDDTMEVMYRRHARCSSGDECWFALYKTSATENAPTYWLDGNPSTYRWWGPTDPNEDVQCIRYTSNGFMDRPCTYTFRYTCKMEAGIQPRHSL